VSKRILHADHGPFRTKHTSCSVTDVKVGGVRRELTFAKLELTGAYPRCAARPG
jgi:hypothetical protein